MWLNWLSKLPLPMLYCLSRCIYFIVYYMIGYRRKIVFNNIANAFPDKSNKEIESISREFYRQLADVFVEAIKGRSINEKALQQRVEFTNPELVTQYAEQYPFVILMAAHQCNWEWLVLASGLQFDYPACALYKPLHNKLVDEFMHACRSRFGVTLIPSHNSIMDIMRNKKECKLIAAVADQAPLQHEEMYWTQVLNQDTSFFVGIEKMAKILKAPVLFISMNRVKRGYYQVTFDVLATPPYQEFDYHITQQYSKAFEQQILNAPSNWLWTNRKWKYKKPIYNS